MINVAHFVINCAIQRMQIYRIQLCRIKNCQTLFIFKSIIFIDILSYIFQLYNMTMLVFHQIQCSRPKLLLKIIFIDIKYFTLRITKNASLPFFKTLKNFFMSEIITFFEFSDLIYQCFRGSFDFPTFRVNRIFDVLFVFYYGFNCGISIA